MTRGRPSPWWLDRRGASSLEFALVALPLLLLVLGGMELARYASTANSLRTVTDEAVRAATLRGSANLVAGRAACNGLGAGSSLLGESPRTYTLRRQDLTLVIDSCTTNGAVTTVGMTTRYSHRFLFSLLAPASGTFVETAVAAFH